MTNRSNNSKSQLQGNSSTIDKSFSDRFHGLLYNPHSGEIHGVSESLESFGLIPKLFSKQTLHRPCMDKLCPEMMAGSSQVPNDLWGLTNNFNNKQMRSQMSPEYGFLDSKSFSMIKKKYSKTPTSGPLLGGLDYMLDGVRSKMTTLDTSWMVEDPYYMDLLGHTEEYSEASHSSDYDYKATFESQSENGTENLAWRVVKGQWKKVFRKTSIMVWIMNYDSFEGEDILYIKFIELDDGDDDDVSALQESQINLPSVEILPIEENLKPKKERTRRKSAIQLAGSEQGSYSELGELDFQEKDREYEDTIEILKEARALDGTQRNLKIMKILKYALFIVFSLFLICQSILVIIKYFETEYHLKGLSGFTDMVIKNELFLDMVGLMITYKAQITKTYPNPSLSSNETHHRLSSLLSSLQAKMKAVGGAYTVLQANRNFRIDDRFTFKTIRVQSEGGQVVRYLVVNKAHYFDALYKLLSAVSKLLKLPPTQLTLPSLPLLSAPSLETSLKPSQTSQSASPDLLPSSEAILSQESLTNYHLFLLNLDPILREAGLEASQGYLKFLAFSLRKAQIFYQAFYLSQMIFIAVGIGFTLWAIFNVRSKNRELMALFARLNNKEIFAIRQRCFLFLDKYLRELQDQNFEEELYAKEEGFVRPRLGSFQILDNKKATRIVTQQSISRRNETSRKRLSKSFRGSRKKIYGTGMKEKSKKDNFGELSNVNQDSQNKPFLKFKDYPELGLVASEKKISATFKKPRKDLIFKNRFKETKEKDYFVGNSGIDSASWSKKASPLFKKPTGVSNENDIHLEELQSNAWTLNRPRTPSSPMMDEITINKRNYIPTKLLKKPSDRIKQKDSFTNQKMHLVQAQNLKIGLKPKLEAVDRNNEEAFNLKLNQIPIKPNLTTDEDLEEEINQRTKKLMASKDSNKMDVILKASFLATVTAVACVLIFLNVNIIKGNNKKMLEIGNQLAKMETEVKASFVTFSEIVFEKGYFMSGEGKIAFEKSYNRAYQEIEAFRTSIKDFPSYYPDFESILRQAMFSSLCEGEILPESFGRLS